MHRYIQGTCKCAKYGPVRTDAARSWQSVTLYFQIRDPLERTPRARGSRLENRSRILQDPPNRTLLGGGRLPPPARVMPAIMAVQAPAVVPRFQYRPPMIALPAPPTKIAPVSARNIATYWFGV